VAKLARPQSANRASGPGASGPKPLFSSGRSSGLPFFYAPGITVAGIPLDTGIAEVLPDPRASSGDSGGGESIIGIPKGSPIGVRLVAAKAKLSALV
jgi:hypothetical protein